MMVSYVRPKDTPRLEEVDSKIEASVSTAFCSEELLS